MQQSKREDLDPHQRDAIISIGAASESGVHLWICIIRYFTFLLDNKRLAS